MHKSRLENFQNEPKKTSTQTKNPTEVKKREFETLQLTGKKRTKNTRSKNTVKLNFQKKYFFVPWAKKKLIFLIFFCFFDIREKVRVKPI